SQVLKEESGTLSAIRIIDTFNAELPPTVEKSTVLALIEAWILVIFKADAACSFTAKIDGIGPAGASLKTKIFPVELKGGVAGHNLMVSVNLRSPLQGVYWFQVWIGEEIV